MIVLGNKFFPPNSFSRISKELFKYCVTKFGGWGSDQKFCNLEEILVHANNAYAYDYATKSKGASNLFNFRIPCGTYIYKI